jgi:hypothetical protein
VEPAAIIVASRPKLRRVKPRPRNSFFSPEVSVTFFLPDGIGSCSRPGATDFRGENLTGDSKAADEADVKGQPNPSSIYANSRVLSSEKVILSPMHFLQGG